jgi:hypothetical protein
VNGKTFVRHVNASGGVKLDKYSYYVGLHLRGQYVVLQIDAPERSLKVEYQHEVIKTIPLKGLVGQILSLEDYVKHIRQEAISEWRRYLAHRPRRLPLAA